MEPGLWFWAGTTKILESGPQSVCEMSTDPSAVAFFPAAIMVQADKVFCNTRKMSGSISFCMMRAFLSDKQLTLKITGGAENGKTNYKTDRKKYWYLRNFIADLAKDKRTFARVAGSVGVQLQVGFQLCFGKYSLFFARSEVGLLTLLANKSK